MRELICDSSSFLDKPPRTFDKYSFVNLYQITIYCKIKYGIKISQMVKAQILLRIEDGLDNNCWRLVIYKELFNINEEKKIYKNEKVWQTVQCYRSL